MLRLQQCSITESAKRLRSSRRRPTAAPDYSATTVTVARSAAVCSSDGWGIFLVGRSNSDAACTEPYQAMSVPDDPTDIAIRAPDCFALGTITAGAPTVDSNLSLIHI